MQKISERSAHLTAVLRAVHQLLDVPPVFKDALALPILGAGDEQAIRAGLDRFCAPMPTALRAFVALRSRVAEDRLKEESRMGVRQSVILGAGLDTFAYRQPTAGRFRVFEVDLPEAQQWKRTRLREAAIAEPEYVSFVALDLERDSLADGLQAAGFRRDEPACFAWLGGTVYLREPAVWSVLQFIGACQAGTSVVFDYGLSPNLMTPSERAAWYALNEQLTAIGEPMLTYFEPDQLVAALLAIGFRRAKSLDVDALNTRYFSGRSDGLRVGETMRLMQAWR